MKIKIIKPIKISSVGKTVLPIDFECEVSKSAGDIYIEKGFAKEVKEDISEKEVLATIKKAKTIDEVEVFMNDSRDKVKTAYEAKKAELNK